MNYKTLILTIDERQIATLTLNRPEVHNVLSLEMIREIRQVVMDLNKLQDVRGGILTGKGKAFWAGADCAGCKK